MTSESDSCKSEYVARINRVIDYIERNIDKQMTLDELARIAAFSPFHFHRIFKFMMDETLSRFIGRLRLEKATTQLLYNPDKSITEIALDCGFTSSAVFARSFKQAFGVSAGEYRKSDGLHHKQLQSNRNFRKTISKDSKDITISPAYIDPQTNHRTWRTINKKGRDVLIKINELPEIEIAYIRHVGPDDDSSMETFRGLYEKLVLWGSSRDLINAPPIPILLLFHDTNEVTDDDKRRVSLCITVPKGTEADGEIGRMTIPGGKYAVTAIEVKDTEEADEVHGAVIGSWLPVSGFQLDDRLAFAIHPDPPKAYMEGKLVFDSYLPIKPL